MLIVIDDCFSPRDILGGGHPFAVSDVRESIPINRMEVSVRTERDQFPKSRSTSGSTRQQRYKDDGVSLNGDEESGPEKL